MLEASFWNLVLVPTSKKIDKFTSLCGSVEGALRESFLSSWEHPMSVLKASWEHPLNVSSKGRECFLT